MRAAWSLSTGLSGATVPNLGQITSQNFNINSPPSAVSVYQGLNVSGSYFFAQPPNAWVPQPITALTGLSTEPMLDLIDYTNGSSGVELPAEDVLLSALGGSLKTGADFSNVAKTTTNTLQYFEHQQNLGRDIASNSLQTANLYPFGQPVLVGEFSVRVVDKTSGFATLISQFTVRILNRAAVLPPQADFSQPFKSLTIVTKTFPICVPENGFFYTLDASYNPTTERVMVQYEAVDAGGNNIAFTLPLQTQSPPAGSTLPIPLNQQRVSYSTAANSTFETASLTLTNNIPGQPYFWQVTQSQINHPAVSHFTGAESIYIVPLPPTTPDPTGDTLAIIVQSLPPTDGPAQTKLLPIDGSQHTDKYGAFAAPLLPLTTLSKKIGLAAAPVPTSASTDLVAAISQSCGLTLLLGQFSLGDLVNSFVLSSPSIPLPNITSTNNAGTVTISMDFSAVGTVPFSATVAPGIAKLTIASIEFHSKSVQATSGTTTTGACTLTSPVIEIPGDGNPLVNFEFNQMQFASSSASKATATVDFNQVVFSGDLTFVNSIIAILPQTLFSNPPEVTITDTECVVDCGVDFPTVGIGVFELANINLDANLAIPFVVGSTSDQIAFTFNFSTVDDPFTVSVMGFAGSGSFGIVISPNSVTVNGSLAFGGSYSVNVIVAQGWVSLEAGVQITYASFTSGSTRAAVDITGFVHLSGGVEVLDIVSLTLDVMLSLAYASSTDSFTGSAQVTLSVDVLFFHTSVSFSISQTFSGSGGSSPEIHAVGLPSAVRNPFAPVPGFLAAVPQQQDWDNYWEAFAA
jgi:hypothetical protein